MYVLFLLISCAVVSGMPTVKILLETFTLLKEKVPRQNIDKLEEYIAGESLKLKKAMSREHMLSEGVSEKHVDVVIKEIKIFLARIAGKITDEIRSQCHYDNMELADVLWCKYCEGSERSIYQEYENDLKKGLFVVAKAWNESTEESVKSCIEFLKRIDGKSSDILAHEERIERKVDNVQNAVDQMLPYIVGNKEKEGSMEGQAVHRPEGKEAAQENTERLDATQHGADDIEEILPDEIAICLAASPEEFQDDINSLQEFIEEQNHSQNEVHLKLQCHIGEGLQDVQQCKYCYILVGTTVEQWMQETYEQAYRHYSNQGHDVEAARLRVCFKTLSDAEIVQAGDNGREELQKRYNEDFNGLPLGFKDINRVKVDILQNLRCVAPKVNFSTASILQFKNNMYFEEACRKRDDLQKQYEDAGDIYDAYKSAEEKNNLELLGEELKEQEEIIVKMEKDIWDNLELLSGKVQDKSSMHRREEEAIEDVIEYGSYGKAEEILRSQEWNQDIADLEKWMKDKKELLRQYVSAQRTLISNLKTRGISSDLENEIIEIYERIINLSKEWQIEYVTMYEYASFLLNQRKYEEGIKVGEELKCLYGLSANASDEDKIKLLMLLGDLYYRDKKYKSGEKNYRDALDILKKGTCKNEELRAKVFSDLTRLLWKTNQLKRAEERIETSSKSLIGFAKRNPEIYEPVLADAYNTRAILANRRNQLDKAIGYHREALEIRERLAEKSSSYNYQPLMDLTSTYNNLGFVYKKRGEYQEAEKYYKKAIEIRMRNAKRNPSAFRPALALVYSNYAVVLNLNGDNKKAQEICEKAYTIRRELAQTNPSYRAELANTLHEYGIILMDAGESKYSDAERYFKEAAEIREELAKKDKVIYGLNLAETYCKYGVLLARMGDSFFEMQYYRDAEEKMEEACRKCKDYSKENEGFDMDKISEIYSSFASLLSERLRKYPEAEKYYEEAVKGWSYLVKQCPKVYKSKLEEAEADLAKLQERMQDMED